MKNLISIKESAEILGVSELTIKNWIKHNFLFPVIDNKKQFFKKSNVLSLKKKIELGEIERLNSRANKRNSSKKFIPQNYLAKLNSSSKLSKLINFIIDNSLSVDCSLFFLIINVLLSENFIYTKNIEKILKFKQSDFKNEHVLNILKDYFNQLNNFALNSTYLQLLSFNIPKSQDILGIIYQSIKSEGEKAKQGSYYTPKNIVENIISEYITKSSTVLDPCCGTGQFLLNFNLPDFDPNNIFGFDIDSTAVTICKINLLLKYKSIKFNPKIFKFNSLIDITDSSFLNNQKLPGSFDLILTNPPWGSHFNQDTKTKLKEKYPAISSLESYSYFLIEGISLLKPGGVLSYILPESILNIKTHRDIRTLILETTNILKIEKLGRAFTKVFTKVIRLDLTRTNRVNKRNSFILKQKRFLKNLNFNFDIEINKTDAEIIEKVYSRPNTTLKNQAVWALGIVTGNNKIFISQIKTKNSEEVITGKDVNKYFLAEAKNYIKFEPERYQQIAPINKYRADEKLIYKFISSKLVFAFDDKQKLTLNSANILIPQSPDIPIKVILALFNSPIYNFIYQKKFNSIKILRGNLEQLPIPILSQKKIMEIIRLVDSAIINHKDISIIDNLIFDLFKVSKRDRIYILKSLKN